MKAYRVPNAPAGERWQRTQADAAAKSKALQAKGKGGFAPFEIATDQRGLLDFLNDLELTAAADSFDERAAPAQAQPAAATVTMTPVTEGVTVTLTLAEEFIQNADVVQLRSLAANVCSRIRELADSLPVKRGDHA